VTDLTTGVFKDTVVAEMDGIIWSIYLGDSVVNSLHHTVYLISYLLIASYSTTNHTLHIR
jgi:hypothetical protein